MNKQKNEYTTKKYVNKINKERLNRAEQEKINNTLEP